MNIILMCSKRRYAFSLTCAEAEKYLTAWREARIPKLDSISDLSLVDSYCSVRRPLRPSTCADHVLPRQLTVKYSSWQAGSQAGVENEFDFRRHSSLRANRALQHFNTGIHTSAWCNPSLFSGCPVFRCSV